MDIQTDQKTPDTKRVEGDEDTTHKLVEVDTKAQNALEVVSVPEPDEKKSQDEYKDYIMKLSEPNCLTRLMVRMPCCVIIVSFILMISVSAVVYLAGWLIPNNPADRDYMVWDDKYVNDWDKTKLAAEELIIKDDSEVTELQSQLENEWTVMFVYDLPSDDKSITNLWTQESLISIREFEKDVKKEEGYKQTCLAKPVSGAEEDVVQCVTSGFASPLDLIPDPSNLENLNQEQLNVFLSQAIGDSSKWKNYNAYFDTEVSASNLTVKFMRTILLAAGPIKDGSIRYDNLKDRSTDQDKFVTKFHKTLREITKKDNEKYKNVNVRIWGRLIYNVIFQEITQGDVAYAAFSFIFVLCYIWFHLGSFFMSMISMLMILMSFPVTYLIYTGIFQVTLNTTLN